MLLWRLLPPPSPLSLLLLILLLACTSSHADKRKKERLFSDTVFIKGHTVTCDSGKAPQDNPVMFPSDTWTCYDIKNGGLMRRDYLYALPLRYMSAFPVTCSRVDGLRVRYWYMPGFGADTACGDGEGKYDARNDMAALCRALLREHKVKNSLWTAFVNDPSCDYIDEQRMIFVKEDEEVYRWENYSKGNGYFKTLRCQVHENT